MLSLERCRKILGENAPVADVDLARLRRHIYGLAHAVVSLVGTRAATREVVDFDSLLRRQSVEDQEALLERAAILEFEGGLPRDEAERAAMTDHLRAKRSS